MTWDELPVVVTVAPTGAEVTRADNPALPHTPAEIAADVAACADAGASVCHIHVREEDGSPSSRRELFEEAIDLIGQRTPIVTMVSTGGAVWMPMEARMTGLEAKPDLAGVETGSMNFGEEAFTTLPADARRVVERGRHQRRLLALALLRGAGGIRVGFEDGVYLRRGVLASSNAELVSDACELVGTLGRRVATIDEARELLSCPAR